LGRGEQLERVPAGPPDVADLRAGLQDHEPQALLGQGPAQGQAGCAAPDPDHVQPIALSLLVRRLCLGHDGLPCGLRATLKLNIMPLCMCSAMWQWAIHKPGLDTSNKMSTTWP